MTWTDFTFLQTAVLADLLVPALLALAFLFFWLWLGARRRAVAAENRVQQMEADRHFLQGQFEALRQQQGEMTGRMQTMAEVFSERQNALNKHLSERLEGMGHRLGESLTQTTQNTHKTLTGLHERLAAIDSAQKNIIDLSRGVVELQSILSNKQTRGAFGQGRMEAIIADALPEGSYQFQASLSNNRRPDCLITLPGQAPPLAIDAKFPLEAWNAYQEAKDDTALKQAAQRFRGDLSKHIRDIHERYLLPGETHDTAFLFVPSESIFADLHEHFEDVVDKALKSRIVIVSPSLLVLSVQVIQVVLRDVRLREQAHLIQDAVIRLMEDVRRLDERVGKLGTHFNQAQRDIEQITITTGKITSRGEKIAEFDVAPPEGTRHGASGAKLSDKASKEPLSGSNPPHLQVLGR
jgi:DNA recombination protein RmuC